MSAPMKPWEQARNLQSSAPMLHNLPGSSSSRSRAGPPSVPPRPAIMGPSTFMSSSYNRSMGVGYSPYDSYNSYGGGYGSYPGYRGGMGGMYGGYGGGMGGMYGNNMYGLGPESRFIQLAEESTRPAFQGIESLVRAFGSIAMMFDSTFFAVQSSFRAVLGVAENFGRIRTMFGQLWQSFALLRFLNWCYRKIMTMFGFKVADDLGKAAWNEAVKEANKDGIPIENTSSWPIFMFLGMIVSAPYLISKLLPPVIDKRDPKNWTSPGRAVRAIHPFQATGPQELSLNLGDKVVLAPMSIQQEMSLGNTGWVYATSKRGAGIIPVNYIQPVGSSHKERDAIATAPPADQGDEFKKLGDEFDKVEATSQEN